jgi:alpha-tubulin suppressor-like RCC1 family protein
VNCGAGEFCRGETAGCVSCIPDQYRCDGSTLKRCNVDGTAESTVENCSVKNLDCNAQLGKCAPYGGGGRYFCNSNGDYTYLSIDGNETVYEYCDGRRCDPNGGGCYGSTPLCTDGAVTCEGRRVRVCDNGYYEENDVSCANNTTCQPGVGCAIPVAIAGGYNHTCAVLAQPDNPDGIGYAVCWGANDHGQLGNGTPIENGGLGDSLDARRVILTFPEENDELQANGFSIAAFSHISAGLDFTCADIQDPESPGEYWVTCWGSNEFGQLGADNSEPGPFNGAIFPFFVYPDSGGAPDENDQLSLRHVTAGAQFACALDPGGAAWCWGKNDAGQLGIDSSDEYLPYASEVEGGHHFVEIAAGARHVCAVDVNNGVWCWGDNSFGQLGQTDDAEAFRVPTRVGELEVSAAGDAFPIGGRDFTAILAPEEDSPLSWGANLFGQLGDGGTDGRNQPGPMSSVSSSDALALFSSSTAQHQCVRDKDNRLSCLGANVFGQLGNKSTVDSTELVQVWDASDETKTLSAVRDAVAVGGRHTCAINANNEVWCWGANHRHQLGSNKVTPQTAPIKVF